MRDVLKKCRGFAAALFLCFFGGNDFPRIPSLYGICGILPKIRKNPANTADKSDRKKFF